MQLLELSILIINRLQLPSIRQFHAAELFLRIEEYHTADPMFTADISGLSPVS
jgi:hypothetical protein